jgi:hypothetical protein
VLRARPALKGYGRGRGEQRRRLFLRIGWALIRAFCAKSGLVDRPERVFGAQFFSPRGGRLGKHRLACAIVCEHVVGASAMRSAAAVRHPKNPHFIGIYVMHENDRVNFVGTNWLRTMSLPRALFSAGGRRKLRRLHTKLSGVTVIFFPL